MLTREIFEADRQRHPERYDDLREGVSAPKVFVPASPAKLTPLSFYVTGDPKGQPRPRAFARKFGDKWSARVYDAGTAEGWKGLIAAECKRHLPPGFTPYSGPVSVDLRFNIARPKAHFTKKGVRPAAPTWCEKRLDCDNLAKAALDCLTQIGLWRDDSQVCVLRIQKQYSIGNSPGGMAITINPLAP